MEIGSFPFQTLHSNSRGNGDPIKISSVQIPKLSQKKFLFICLFFRKMCAYVFYRNIPEEVP